jgi:hypothetical protein
MQFDIVANDKATGTMRAAEGSMEKFTNRLGTNFTKIAMKAAAAIAVIRSLSGVFNEGANIVDNAKRLNISIDLYQRLSKAAELFGASQQELTKGFKDLNKMIDEAATKGKGEEFKALQALGFSDQEIMNREVKRIEVLERLADAMAAVSDEEQKFAIASRVLGDKAAMALMPILDNFEEFKDVMENAPVLSDAEAHALDQADDARARLTQTVTTGINRAIAGATNLVTSGSLEGAGIPAAPSASAEGQARAKALLGVGAQVEKGNTDGGGGLAVTSLQEIGGGLGKGVSITELYAERTAQATETIAAVVTASPAPAPSATDITKPSEQSSSVATPSTSAPSSTIKNMSNAFFRGRSPF